MCLAQSMHDLHKKTLGGRLMDKTFAGKIAQKGVDLTTDGEQSLGFGVAPEAPAAPQAVTIGGPGTNSTFRRTQAQG